MWLPDEVYEMAVAQHGADAYARMGAARSHGAHPRDALSGCRGDEVEMSTRGELSPIVVRSPGEAMTHVVMPMRLVGS
jgi:hypothetical protein